MFGSWLWIALMRVLLPACSLVTAARAARNLWSLNCSGAAATTQGVVLAVEAPLNAVFCGALLLGAGTWSSDIVSDPMHSFFSNAGVGTELFTTLAVALFWHRAREEKQRGLATRSAREAKRRGLATRRPSAAARAGAAAARRWRVRRAAGALCTDRALLACIAAFTIGTDVVVSGMSAAHTITDKESKNVRIGFLAANLAAAAFFLVSAFPSFVAVVEVPLERSRRLLSPCGVSVAAATGGVRGGDKARRSRRRAAAMTRRRRRRRSTCR
ncbi:hypothetical protein M885DRAFT_259748 [Pelagophyceae sp. CCMP2097]|nr:hypothetical protein M885DRAFT_259748 [Pelagophyceae sp. CCMP2097]